MKKRHKKLYLGIDQYGGQYKNLEYPRRDLKKILGGRIYKMYVDGLDNKIYHIGYVVRGRYIRLFEYVQIEEHVTRGE